MTVVRVHAAWLLSLADPLHWTCWLPFPTSLTLEGSALPLIPIAWILSRFQFLLIKSSLTRKNTTKLLVLLAHKIGRNKSSVSSQSPYRHMPVAMPNRQQLLEWRGTRLLDLGTLASIDQKTPLLPYWLWCPSPISCDELAPSLIEPTKATS